MAAAGRRGTGLGGSGNSVVAPGIPRPCPSSKQAYSVLTKPDEARVEPQVAIVHDYLTQRGGAERVVLVMLEAFPQATLFTSLYEPSLTYTEFSTAEVRTSTLNRVNLFRRHHRLALPLLAHTFSDIHVEADVVLCSSSGWAHGVAAAGRKVVFCYNPARWLYQRTHYFRPWSPSAAGSAPLRPFLRRWDLRAARSADRYVVISTAVRERVMRTYGIDAEVLPPPYGLQPGAPEEPVTEVEAPFCLCVSRLLPYKNIDVLITAFARLRDVQLVIVGTGPDEKRLRRLAGSNVRFVGAASDAQLRWLYSRCAGVVSAAIEDFGLTAVEAAIFGAPTAVLRAGGFLDSVVEGVTGVFFESPDAAHVRAAVRDMLATTWDQATLRAHAERFGPRPFIDRLRRIVQDVAAER